MNITQSSLEKGNIDKLIEKSRLSFNGGKQFPLISHVEDGQAL